MLDLNAKSSIYFYVRDLESLTIHVGEKMDWQYEAVVNGRTYTFTIEQDELPTRIEATQFFIASQIYGAMARAAI